MALPSRIRCIMGRHGQTVTDEPSLSSRPPPRTVTLSGSVLLHCLNLPLDSTSKWPFANDGDATAAMFRLHLAFGEHMGAGDSVLVPRTFEITKAAHQQQ